MAYLDRRNVYISVVAAALVGCTTNPLFHIESDSGVSDGTDETTSGGMSSQATSEPQTSDVPTSGDGTTGIGGETSTGDVLTGDVTSGEPGTSSGPDATATSIDPQTTTVDPDSGESGGNVGCGDGLLQPPEQCDEGAENSEGGACLPNCEVAVCGDGFVHAGEEECDDGPDNGEFGECTSECAQTYCGDGAMQAGEVCDSGAQNGSGLGFCSPDCLGMVVQKFKIVLTANGVAGDMAMNLGPKGVIGADKLCQAIDESYRAMLSDGVTRVASQGPWTGGGVDWVLKPFTAYVDAQSMLIGVTGAEALLGAHAEPPGTLKHSIHANGGLVWTGLNDDWTSAEMDCTGWTVKGDGLGVVGQAMDMTNQYLHLEGMESPCAESRRLYCVQTL